MNSKPDLTDQHDQYNGNKNDDRINGELFQIKPSKKTKKKKLRPARIQKEPGTVDDQPPQTGTVFNIWYLKWSGGDKEDGMYNQRKADSRCVISTDSGYTKANEVPGSYICLYFARGMCSRGKNCDYLHRLPTEYDIYSQNVDCFGRDKFADYRDDMGGVGSFLRQTRTLYVGRINSSDNVEDVISRHFQEWGKIERIRVLNNRGVAFVTYANEANSQFAKEAMAHQSLDNNEILNLRWATEDPNPLAQAREKRRIEEQAADAIRKFLPKELINEVETTRLSSKRKKISREDRNLDGNETADNKIIEESSSYVSLGPNSPNMRSQITEKEYTNKKPGLFSSGTLNVLRSLCSKDGSPVTASIVADYDSE
ncbi:uncharacterized protein SAPINGB_P005636 [Magnusiomyces paraingens]|uniref:Pre-mRNA-splicing factor CWC2 n=1 Tax=Magnusiomyces paraingens TaxID=2606893 RepID=A0A5E8C2Q0_9ASCO|nr:uncharacterized protein SAPINGB_P005636 [Saprochaete ingens]VVT57280.1 unnamed protein product [Saprochaete ingens]